MPPALAVETRSGAALPAVGHQRRLDIEGLRAIAVVAVVLDHLFHWPQGGFVGVDIFFVISGYLISGILLREASTTGRISFRQFYVRRIKRILPAAVVVLSVTVTAAYVVFYAGRASSIAGDSLWALLFSANWRFAILGTDYMNSGSSVSPIQHYWSLGVEEQFYILWPWIILGALWLARRLRANSRGTVAILTSVIAVSIFLSFAFALWETQTHHTVAYFSTFSRGWELSAGALLAVLTTSFKGFAQPVRAVLMWLGLTLLVVSSLFISPETPFPAPNAVYPVVGACMVILAGAGMQSDAHDRMAWILTNPISRYVGKISYSLYLWHFPVIVIVGALLPSGSKRYYVMAVAVMVLLSVCSFILVEDPIRRSSFGAPRVRTQHRPRRRRSKPAVVAIFAAILVAAPVTASATLGQQRTADAGSPSGGVESPKSMTATTLTGRQEQLRAALVASQWPALTPDPAGMGPDGALAKPGEWTKDGCLGGELSPLAHDKDVTRNAARCVYGSESAAKSIIVFGDSTTMSFVPGIRKALEGQDVKIYVYTVAACSPTLVPVGQDASADECIRFKGWVQEEIKRLHPATVVSSFLRNDGHLASHAVGPAADAEWQRNIAAMGDFVIRSGARYVLLEAPAPAKADPSLCITRFSTPGDCVTQRASNFDNTSEVERRALAGLSKSALYVPTKDWFCVDGQCPAFIGNTALYADINHISARASEELGPLIAGALLGS
ncbi:acyltransferase [Arthrobacter sp. ISL-48]|uniref:acyltransferase family protein n=1 Tax=Arthrobacter sp. ISL-48 TaxID=2819110 RepID=UPI001BE9033A|nr:acyltransferase family protein [Arthrobacter sp. ISL-48]MBT2531852.1 acyltransferase [Arthrobacter sp. ISL-48]